MNQQADKARAFAELHQPGNPIELFNIWDAGSAKAVADAGATALATGSWSVAAAQGYPDGQAIPLDLAWRITERICDSVDLPVSLDFEGGYAEQPEELAAHMPALLKTGVVGINFEDQIVGGQGIYDLNVQTARIEALRLAANQAGIPLFINARTDLFLKEPDLEKHANLIPQAKDRAEAYREAGADGFFVPWLSKPALIEEFCATVKLPVNIMWHPGMGSPKELAALGVARISCGPQPYRTAMKTLADQYRQTFGNA